MGAPKALAVLDGRTLLEHLLAPDLLQNLGDVVVILGHHAEVLRPIVERSGYRHVVNPEPDRGRNCSVQTGLRALAEDIQAAFVQPVDCPLIARETYLALAEAMPSVDVAIPSFGERRGHPPLVSAAVFPKILAAKPDEPLRNLLRGPGVRWQDVAVNDPGVLLNVDRPEDLDQVAALYDARRQLLKVKTAVAKTGTGSERNRQ